MALAKQNVQFEDEGNNIPPAQVKDADAASKVEASTTIGKAAAGAAEGTTAIAKAQSTAVAVPTKFGDVYKKFENVINDLEFGTVARLVGSNGRIQAKKDGKTFDLGDQIRVQLVSYNESYQISPGDDSPAAKAAVRYSRDGVTIDGPVGGLVDAYVTKLKEVDGFPKASKKKYTSLVAILSEVSVAGKDQSLVNEMVEVSLSPTAGKAFQGLRLQRSVKVNRGLATEEGSENLVVRAEVRQNGTNAYTALAVSDK